MLAIIPTVFLFFVFAKYIVNCMCVKNASYKESGDAWFRDKRLICYIPNPFYVPIQNSEFVLFEKRKNFIALMANAKINISLLRKSFEKNEWKNIDKNIGLTCQ